MSSWTLVPLGGPYYTVSRGQEGETDTDFAAVALGVTKRFANATLTATTSYWVRVTNSAGVADSSSATVTVTAGGSDCSDPRR